MKPAALRPPPPDWQMLPPDPRLRPHVLCYYLALPQAVSQLRSEPAAQGGEELLLPDGHSEIVFTIDHAFERWAVGAPEQRDVMRDSYVIGGRSCSVVTRDLGPVAVAGIKLDPRALRWLLRIPLSEFRDATPRLHELAHAPLLALDAEVLHAATLGPASAQALARVLDRFLLRALSDMPAAARPVDALLAQLRASQGALPILSWVERHGLCARQIEREFARATGMSPKRYARIIRFKHSYHQLVSPPSSARRTHLDGYYDQSHFNKDFRAFLGASPGARLAARLRQCTSISEQLLDGELSRAAHGCASSSTSSR